MHFNGLAYPFSSSSPSPAFPLALSIPDLVVCFNSGIGFQGVSISFQLIGVYRHLYLFIGGNTDAHWSPALRYWQEIFKSHLSSFKNGESSRVPPCPVVFTRLYLYGLNYDDRIRYCLL